MIIWRFALKEIKSDFRDTKTLLFLLAFPIVLMLILGTALTNVFNTPITIADMHVLYKISTENAAISDNWAGFTKEAEHSGVHFEQVSPSLDGKREVLDNKYNAYVEIENAGLHLYNSSADNIESNIIQGMLTVYADKYNLIAEIAKAAPEQMPVVSNVSKDDYITEKALNSAEKPGSLDYYAIAVTTMIALYAAMASSHLINGERLSKTSIRLMAAPITKSEIFIGKILGSIVLNSLCIGIVVLFSKFVFKANWGEHYGMVSLVLFTEVVFAISLGMGMSAIVKGEAARSILMIFIQLASFLGGAYYPFDGTPGLMNTLSYISPLRWANDAITHIIYTNDGSAASSAIALNLGLAAFFILIAAITLRRKEGL